MAMIVKTAMGKAEDRLIVKKVCNYSWYSHVSRWCHYSCSFMEMNCSMAGPSVTTTTINNNKNNIQFIKLLYVIRNIITIHHNKNTVNRNPTIMRIIRMTKEIHPHDKNTKNSEQFRRHVKKSLRQASLSPGWLHSNGKIDFLGASYRLYTVSNV